MTNTWKGYSLWLVPRNPARKAFQTIITRIAKEQHAPAFTPHITLLSNLFNEKEALAHTAQLARSLHPFRQTFGSIGTQTFFFRALFLHAKTSRALLHARKTAEHVFLKNKEPYMPHLSLLYATKTPAQKKRIISQLPKLPNQCIIDTLILCNCTGKVAQWKKVRTFKLK